MADKPIKSPNLPELPTDWKMGQIVSPNGTETGLTEKHGYNYLMQVVNQQAEYIKTMNDAFAGLAKLEDLQKAIFLKE